jgi:hypothetical protein
MSNEQLENEIINAMNEINIRHEILYAFKKTGLLISTENKDKVTEQYLNDWHKASQEFVIPVGLI